MTNYPIAGNAALVDPAMVAAFVEMLFGFVEQDDGCVLLRGVGEKATPREGVHREPIVIDPRRADVTAAIVQHATRWAQHHVATFIVPAVMDWQSADDKSGAEARVNIMTALVVDIDRGDTDAALAWARQHVGQPTMVVNSGGVTDQGQLKYHVWWRLSEPTADVKKVADLRGALALRVGGDTSFKRVAQVIRVPGTAYGKGGVARTCAILEHQGRPWPK